MQRIESKRAHKALLNSLSKFDRDALIGFLLAALNDGMFEPPEPAWTLASNAKMRDWCADSFINAAQAILDGKVLPSELRGPKPFGVA